MELIKITPDRERAKNILKMVSLLEERIRKQNRKKMTALIIADYYEIIRELITAILLIDGYKTLSHKGLVDYLKDKYSEFSTHETSLLDNLRILRNRVTYEGFFVDMPYLTRNEGFFKKIIKKLKTVINKKLR